MGYGDEIMASAEARELKRQYPDAKIVVGDGTQEYWSELFESNPNIARLGDIEPGDPIIWLHNHYGARPYLQYPIDGRAQCFKSYNAKPGDIFPAQHDHEAADSFFSLATGSKMPWVYIEPNVDFGSCKDWGFPRYQEVVYTLQKEVRFVQPDYGKAILDGVQTFHSGSFLRGTAFLMRADLYLGPEGGMHHAAAAIGKEAIVLFGGRISPIITGYSFHNNLYVDLPGSPCGSLLSCNHCQACFNEIKVEQVVDLIRDVLGTM